MSTTRTPPPKPSRRLPPTARPPRRRRLGFLLVPLALIVLAGAALVGVHYAADSGSARPDTSNLRFVELAKSQFAGIPSTGSTIGSETAPVTITEYGDLRCPVCRDFDANVVPDVVTKLVKTGRAKLVYQHWPILGENSVYAGRAAYAAQRQDRLWEYAQIVYFNQGDERDSWFDERFARAVASAAGLDMARFDRDFDETGMVEAQTQATDRAATDLGLQGTPSLRITGKGGQPITFTGSVPSYEQIADAVQKVTPA
jgi:protein-disulfide isomerase